MELFTTVEPPRQALVTSDSAAGRP
jgi:hypothetical protein